MWQRLVVQQIFTDAFSSFVLLTTITITYFSFNDIPSFKHLPTSTNTHNEMVSIIVPAKDEEDTIELCLTSLLNLEYRNKEIIVVSGKSKERKEEIDKR